MIVLGIESSCDETSIALLKDGKQILSLVTHTQIKDHQIYGGVVPEVASRKHLEYINPLLEQAFAEAKLKWDQIDGIAVAQGPGLQGALLVGVTAAQTLAQLLKKPLMGVNHLEGHIYANFLAFGEQIEFPLLVLLVSGGHTQLIEMTGHHQYKVVGETRDDALGEAFDKSARIMGLGYPGGPEIDALAVNGDAKAFDFPIAIPKEPDFSFSGLKTSVLYKVKDLKKQSDELPLANLCASFQKAAIGAVIKKTFRYAKAHQIKQISITGGVSANSYLRAQLKQIGQSQNISVFMPPLSLCTDNAAMIAACGYYQFKDEKVPKKIEIYPRYPIST